MSAKRKQNARDSTRARREQKLSTNAKARKFLFHFERWGLIAPAAKAAGIARADHYRWLKSCAGYKEAWEEADINSEENLLAALRKRGEVGAEEPVFYQGVRCGVVRRYDTAAAKFVLKVKNREKYGDQIDARHSGSVTFEGLAEDIAKGLERVSSQKQTG